MKILLLSQFFSTSKGGGEYVFSVLAQSLAQDGHKVWIITNRIKDEKYLSHSHIKIIFVPPQLEYRGGLPQGLMDNIRYSINATLKGFSLIRKEKIQIIHSNNFAPALAGSLLSSLTRVPHITAVHDIFSLCGKNYWKLWGKQANVARVNVILGPFFEKLMLKLNHRAIHTVSEATKDDLIKFGAKKPIYVISNVLENNNMLTTQEPIDSQFIYIGRLVFYKNLEVVFRAINLVKKSYPKIMLIIVGGGPHKKNLENLVKDLGLQNNIKFSGFVSLEEKVKLLGKSQALVFPSLCEGFGLVILEAFAQKKPVIVANVRPLSDIVSDKINGFVISPHNEKEWAEALIKIIKNPENSNRMGQSGRELLEDKYNIQKMLKGILEMYKNVIGKE